jgi:hypothetical protein
MKNKIILGCCVFLYVVLLMVGFNGCGKTSGAYDKNLLDNPSFEKGNNNIPDGWKLEVFHGMKGDNTVKYGFSTSEKHEGKQSFCFQGDEDTKEWLMLTQEVKIPDTRRVQLRGAMKVEKVWRNQGQWAQSNFSLIYYDKDHKRFQEVRYNDRRTRVRKGHYNWFVEDAMFSVPKNTVYVKVACVLGMQGSVWFDDVSLSVPKPLAWKKESTKNFDFYSLPARGYPAGAIENEQELFDSYCKSLGVQSDTRISYYLYPDSASIMRLLSLKGVTYVNWEDVEIHTIYPNEEHEIVHFITDRWGRPPVAFNEGCAYYLIGNWKGEPVHKMAKELLAKERLPSLKSLFNFESLSKIPYDWSVPACASFFGFLYEFWGPGKIMDLFGAANGANSYNTFAIAFKKVYEGSIEEAEKRWHQYLVSNSFDASKESKSEK